MALKTYTPAELQDILRKHAAWKRGEADGVRADLRGADLTGAYLTGAYLRGADLRGADLRGAYLRGADLRGADLRGAYLRGAYLRGADLRGADLRGADLRGADLRGADLRGAYLRGADLTDINLAAFRIVPEVGAFQGFKKLANGSIAHLEIPATAARVGGLLGRKCRAESAVVLSIVDGEGEEITTPVPSCHAGNFFYEAGKIVTPDAWNDDERLECTNGIHFFLSLSEAEAYS